MSDNYKHVIFQALLLTFWSIAIVITQTSVDVTSKSCTNIGYLATPPARSWPQGKTVTVRIDSNWNQDERDAFQAGIMKWNDANNCSGVHFTNFSPQSFTTAEYTNDAPDNTLYWLK